MVAGVSRFLNDPALLGNLDYLDNFSFDGVSLLDNYGSFNNPDLGSFNVPDLGSFNVPDFGSLDYVPDLGSFDYVPDMGSFDLLDLGSFDVGSFDVGSFDVPDLLVFLGS